MGENTALPQSTTNDRVSDKICYVRMNLFIKNDVIMKTQKKGLKTGTSIIHYFVDRLLLLLPLCSLRLLIPSSWAPTLVSSLPTDRLV